MVKKINLMLLLLIFLISNLLAEEKLDHKIENITFNEITQNEVILKVKLPKNYGDIFIEKESDQVKVEIKNTQLAKKWQHQMDVSEINSIISTIDGNENKDNTTFLLKLKKIEKTKNFTVVKSIKNNNLLITISILEQLKDLKQASIENEKISLNLDQVPVQSALQILADSAKLNLVLSDEIKGNITLKLNDVPWREVLNIILSTKNLGKREIGASLYIAPSEVITKQEEDLLKVKFRLMKEQTH